MTNSGLIKALEAEVKNRLEDAEKGHDWFHIQRVRKQALNIQAIEGGNAFHIELAALLHDIDDPKFNGGDVQAGGLAAAEILRRLGAEAGTIKAVSYLVEHCGYKGGNSSKEPNLDLQILRDADRLDAIGAIGIARTFNYGGFKNQALYDPEIPVREEISVAAYYQEKSSTINHFYEKLLKLKDGMYTATARKLAEKRHLFLEQFLDQFFQEWHSEA